MQMSIWVFTVIMTNKRGAWKHSKNIPGRLRADGDWAVAGGPTTSWWSLPVQRNLDPGWDPDDGELHELPFSAELGFGEIHLRVLSHEPVWRGGAITTGAVLHDQGDARLRANTRTASADPHYQQLGVMPNQTPWFPCRLQKDIYHML